MPITRKELLKREKATMARGQKVWQEASDQSERLKRKARCQQYSRETKKKIVAVGER